MLDEPLDILQHGTVPLSRNLYRSSVELVYVGKEKKVHGFRFFNRTVSFLMVRLIIWPRDLGNSNLSGHLVPQLGKLEHLQYLELYKNNIQGAIPIELGNLKSLISLDLYNNNLSGIIPPSLGKLKSLVFLRLNDNKLNGPIPRGLINIASLKVVDVSNNDLCGTIPTTGPFEHFPLSNFENNPRLEGPELQGLASYDTNC